MKDLVVLVADKTMEYTLRGGLERDQALGIRPITCDFRQHPNRDGGARTTGAQMLALELTRFSHALLVLDHEGSGASESALVLEQQLDEELSRAWQANAKAIVIDPELDTWAWGADNLLAELLAWREEKTIRCWLEQEGFALDENEKPERPKEALEAVFRVCRLPMSAANYQKIANRISLSRCFDPAFLRLRDRLRMWFPPGT